MSGDLDSFAAAISGNGSFVVFTSRATDLVEEDLNGSMSDVLMVFLDEERDPALVSVKGFFQQSQFPMSTNSDGSIGVPCGATTCSNGPLASPDCPCISTCSLSNVTLSVGRVISDDGRFVLMHGAPIDWGSDLCPDPNVNPCAVRVPQVYLRDMEELDTFLVSKVGRTGSTAGCFPANGCSRRASISADGSRVVYNSFATNLRQSGCDSDCFDDVFSVSVAAIIGGNCSSVIPLRVSVGLCGAASDEEHSFQAALSSDGSLVAFASRARNLLLPSGGACPDTNSVQDIFVGSVSGGATRPKTSEEDSAFPASRGRVVRAEYFRRASWAASVHPFFSFDQPPVPQPRTAG